MSYGVVRIRTRTKADEAASAGRLESIRSKDALSSWSIEWFCRTACTSPRSVFSAFLPGSSEIAPYLRGRGIDTVLIGGTATNVCCESSARDAMMLNFKVVMVHDVLATYTDEEHNATLRNFYSIFGDVQTLDEVIGSLKRGLEKAAA